MGPGGVGSSKTQFCNPTSNENVTTYRSFNNSVPKFCLSDFDRQL